MTEMPRKSIAPFRDFGNDEKLDLMDFLSRSGKLVPPQTTIWRENHHNISSCDIATLRRSVSMTTSVTVFRLYAAELFLWKSTDMASGLQTK